jgi:glycosyltransferase involved in cell wall biosynthesis
MKPITETSAPRDCKPTIVAIIPAYNEREHIAPVVDAARAATLVERVIVVDDGSKDDTSVVAKEHGATVIRRYRNGGKAAAMATAVSEVDADYYVFLDADLVGIEGWHVDELIKPVLAGRRVVTMGQFRGGRLSTDLSQRITPGITGQRVLPRELARELPGLSRCGYAIELALNDLAKSHGYKIVLVPMENVTQVMKEEKVGFARGFARRLRMYADMARYLFKKYVSLPARR